MDVISQQIGVKNKLTFLLARNEETTFIFILKNTCKLQTLWVLPKHWFTVDSEGLKRLPFIKMNGLFTHCEAGFWQPPRYTVQTTSWWFFSHPSQKNANRQIGPGIGVKIPKMFELPPPGQPFHWHFGRVFTEISHGPMPGASSSFTILTRWCAPQLGNIVFKRDILEIEIYNTI